MRQRDFEVIIECDGQPLDEYAVSIDGNSIESFVVSEPGKVRAIGPVEQAGCHHIDETIFAYRSSQLYAITTRTNTLLCKALLTVAAFLEICL